MEAIGGGVFEVVVFDPVALGGDAAEAVDVVVAVADFVVLVGVRCGADLEAGGAGEVVKAIAAKVLSLCKAIAAKVLSLCIAVISSFRSCPYLSLLSLSGLVIISHHQPLREQSKACLEDK